MPKRQPRFPFLALIVGLVLGSAGGLFYSWFWDPVSWTDISPKRLSPGDRQDYILLIAEAYLQDRDLERARSRLQALDVRDITGVVKVQADTAFLQGQDPNTVRALTTLAEALGASPLGAEVFSGTGAPTVAAETATITATFQPMPSPTPSAVRSTSTPTPAETLTPTATVISATSLDLIALETICEDDHTPGRIEIYVRDVLAHGIPGVEVVIEWAGGQDIFYTGLKPEISPGYADFQMELDQVYTVTLSGLSEPVAGLRGETCTTPLGQVFIVTYQLVFAPEADSIP